MNHEDQHRSDTHAAKPSRRTIMPTYYKMSQDLGPLPKRFAAKRVRILIVAILAVVILALALHFWW